MKPVNPDRRAWLAAALLLALVPGHAAQPSAAIDGSSPQKLIETAAGALLADLDANRDAYRKDTAALQKMIETRFLPHVDVNYAAGQVVGNPWRNASPELRQRFIEALKKVMLATYASALLDFTADNLRIKPFRGDAAATSATVDTEITRSNGAVVAVSFILRKPASATAWKVWDVQIEGIRYVGIFRSDFAAEISQKGLEALVARLEAQQKVAAR